MKYMGKQQSHPFPAASPFGSLPAVGGKPLGKWKKKKGK